MKQFKLLTLAAVLFFTACNNETKTDTSNIDSSSPTAEGPLTIAPKPADVMVMKHKVANFSKWLEGYEAGDSMRQAAGLHNFVIGRGVDDSNMVIVFVRMDDTARAKAMVNNPGLKTVMQKAGVTSQPEVKFLNMQTLNTTGAAVSSGRRVMVTHQVKDWTTWKTSFDDHLDVRTKAGIADRGVGYSFDDNHWVTVVFTITDMEKANEFFMSKELKDKMAEGGVVSKPEIFTYNVAKQY